MDGQCLPDPFLIQPSMEEVREDDKFVEAVAEEHKKISWYGDIVNCYGEEIEDFTKQRATRRTLAASCNLGGRIEIEKQEVGIVRF